MPHRLRLWHRGFGAFLGVFLIAHLGNHVALLSGEAAHIRVMDSLRVIYRNPIVETLLLAGLLAQIVLGVRLIRQRGRPTSVWAWAQVLSGGYLAFFLAQHVPAVLFGRIVSGLDTNIYFAAATVAQAPLSYYFAPYYAFAVAAVFIHLAAALRFAIWPRSAGVIWALPVLGLGFGLAVVLGLMDIAVPGAYQL